MFQLPANRQPDGTRRFARAAPGGSRSTCASASRCTSPWPSSMPSASAKSARRAAFTAQLEVKQNFLRAETEIGLALLKRQQKLAAMAGYALELEDRRAVADRRSRAGRAVVGAPHRLRPGQFAQRSIDRPDRDAICLGRARDHLGPGGIARRQQRQAPAQVGQRLTRGALRAVSHASRSRRRRRACPRGGTGWPLTRPCAWPRRAPQLPFLHQGTRRGDSHPP